MWTESENEMRIQSKQNQNNALKLLTEKLNLSKNFEKFMFLLI